MKKELFKKILLIVVLTVFAEVFIFNYHHWTSLNYEPIEIEVDDEYEEGYSDSAYVDFQGYEVKIHNIAFTFEHVIYKRRARSTATYTYERRLPITLSFYCPGENEKTLFCEKVFPYYDDDKLVTMTLPHEVSPGQIYVTADQGKIKSMYINTPVPMSFSVVRCLILIISVLMIWGLFIDGKLWQKKVFIDDGMMDKGVLAGVSIIAGLVFLLILFLLKENPMFSENADVFQFYPTLARSFAAGHTYDMEAPDPQLLSLEDPYDIENVVNQGIPYKLDRLLYDGRYYVYFGPLPCLVFYLPYYLLTGRDMSIPPVIISLVIFFLTAWSLFLKELYLRYNRNGSTAMFICSFIFGVLITPLSVMAGGDTFPYYMPLLMALDLFLLGGYFYLCAVKKIDRGEKAYVTFAAGSFCIALIAACRPNMLFLAAAYAPLLINYAGLKKENAGRWISFIAPVIVVAIPVMLYNFFRFGNPLDYGAAYGLTIDGAQKHPSINSMLNAFKHYLVRPVHFTKDFPYVLFEKTEWSNPENILNPEVSGGIFILFPILFFSLGAFLPIKLCGMKRDAAWIARTFVISASLVLLISSIYGGFTTRYRMDFSIAYLIAALIVFWNVMKEKRRTRMILCGMFILCFLSSILQYFTPDLSRTAEKTDFIYRFAEIVEFWK